MTGNPIPDEPEVLQLWRQIAAHHDDLVAKIQDWERKDHPAMRDLLKISKLYGRHGKTERRMLELDQEAQAIAQHYRHELDALHEEVRVAMRDATQKCRGSSVEQLRELVEPRQARERAARAALERWWKEDTWLTRYAVHHALSELGVLVPDDQMQKLKDDDLAFRRMNAGAPSGNPSASAGRVLQRLLAAAAPRQTCTQCGEPLQDVDGSRACVNPDCVVGIRVE